MANIEAALVGLLQADSNVDALVVGRIWAVKLPQDSPMPALVFQRVTTSRGRLLSGPDGRAEATFQIDSYAESFGAARDLADAVRIALDGYQGTAAGVIIGDIAATAEQDLLESAAAPGGKPLYRTQQDYLVIHTE